jgi:uncharacterized protein YbjT (DUF2867 family)
MILVTGASGKTGRAVIEALMARGESVHAFVHRDQQILAARALGAKEVSVGSLDDVAALVHAARQVRGIYHICPNVSSAEVAYGHAIIAAATACNVKRLVFHSVLHPQTEAMPHHWDKLRVEELLLQSGLDVTFLQPTSYMQNILGGWQSIMQQGIHRVPYAVESRLSLVDLEDVAEVAARVLSEPGHIGATYELVGTAALSQVEVAEVLSQALERPVRAEALSVDEWEASARKDGIGDYQRDVLIKMFRYCGEFGLTGNSNVLRWLLNRAPTSLIEFATRTRRECR